MTKIFNQYYIKSVDNLTFGEAINKQFIIIKTDFIDLLKANVIDLSLLI
ncbi:hypothetical protein Bccel_0363 [Pseudobacteroides cellulosolvens ATCC 35603 = DSM 2933]|uniref:Uncharacterized protein n=1 Tax=Pseudobacteroides cellulosolvens ATCC 35603 = DSM 2933 TaxID=398512 RepID=A0A0L6JGW3_9FIRM|nr:hypothetical protein Bccel_0363 [Pseudobacteroides cellulosolvens ATCC 35603 = DSM 2933]